MVRKSNMNVCLFMWAAQPPRISDSRLPGHSRLTTLVSRSTTLVAPNHFPTLDGEPSAPREHARVRHRSYRQRDCSPGWWWRRCSPPDIPLLPPAPRLGGAGRIDRCVRRGSVVAAESPNRPGGIATLARHPFKTPEQRASPGLENPECSFEVFEGGEGRRSGAPSRHRRRTRTREAVHGPRAFRVAEPHRPAPRPLGGEGRGGGTSHTT